LAVAQDVPGLFEEQPTILGQLDATPDAVKKRDGVTCFERLNGPADRRLGQPQALRRAGHVLALGNRNEDGQLIQRHERVPAIRG
jgi:hypothetical protein